MLRQSNLKFYLLFVILMTGCQAKFLRVDDKTDLGPNKAYEDKIEIKALPVEPEVAQTLEPAPEASTVPKEVEKTKTVKKPKAVAKSAPPTPSPKMKLKREPDLEDAEGFDGRRPIKDPFWVGEKVVLEISYFGAAAGDMTMEVRPFVEVNGRKSYHLSANLKSSSFFSTFYAVDDYGETFVDFENLIPFNYVVKVKESAQLRDVRSFFDWKTMKAFFWEKKVTKKHGTQEKNMEWDILPYTHNIFSAPFYLRVFKLTPGKVISFRVADEQQKNMVVKAHVLRKERIKTMAGEFDTVVIRPEVQIDGIFKPMGDVFFWLTDDDRKFFVKIEAKIKIGTLKGEAKSISHGVAPH